MKIDEEFLFYQQNNVQFNGNGRNIKIKNIFMPRCVQFDLILYSVFASFHLNLTKTSSFVSACVQCAITFYIINTSKSIHCCLVRLFAFGCLHTSRLVHKICWFDFLFLIQSLILKFIQSEWQFIEKTVAKNG